MLIHGIEELAVGQDRVIAQHLHKHRTLAGVTLEAAAWTIGADPHELQLLENGRIDSFSDFERLRLVLSSYCDYLGLDPGPLVSRLEGYSRHGMYVPPNLFAVISPQQEGSWPSRSFQALIYAGSLFLPLIVAWTLIRF